MRQCGTLLSTHPAAVASEAHGLIGAANLGATALTALLIDIEELSRAGQTPGADTLARLSAESRGDSEAVAALRGGAASAMGRAGVAENQCSAEHAQVAAKLKPGRPPADTGR